MAEFTRSMPRDDRSGRRRSGCTVDEVVAACVRYGDLVAAEAHACITDTLDSWREVGRLEPPVWADASGAEPALPLVRPSRRKPARVERRAVVYGRAGARYIATIMLGTG
jgi:hypothetical protein